MRGRAPGGRDRQLEFVLRSSRRAAPSAAQPPRARSPDVQLPLLLLCRHGARCCGPNDQSSSWPMTQLSSFRRTRGGGGALSHGPRLATSLVRFTNSCVQQATERLVSSSFARKSVPRRRAQTRCDAAPFSQAQRPACLQDPTPLAQRPQLIASPPPPPLESCCTSAATGWGGPVPAGVAAGARETEAIPVGGETLAEATGSQHGSCKPEPSTGVQGTIRRLLQPALAPTLHKGAHSVRWTLHGRRGKGWADVPPGVRRRRRRRRR